MRREKDTEEIKLLCLAMSYISVIYWAWKTGDRLEYDPFAKAYTTAELLS